MRRREFRLWGRPPHVAQSRRRSSRPGLRRPRRRALALRRLSQAGADSHARLPPVPPRGTGWERAARTQPALRPACRRMREPPRAFRGDAPKLMRPDHRVALAFPGQSAAISRHSAHPRRKQPFGQGRQCRPPDDRSPENVSRGRPEAGVDLAELKRGQCLYPVGELQSRQLLYCGKPSLPGKSWCAAHRRICVSP